MLHTAISVKDLTFHFPGRDRPALTHINLDIAQGEFVVVTGPSGSGKSTLAMAIGGYLFNQVEGDATGTVSVLGLDVRKTPMYDIAELVGLVQQNPQAQFCTLKVEDEIAFGLENRCLSREIMQQRLTWALEIVGGLHLIHRPLATLSGGEQQKVAIAAMMATKPQILIFDEPTSNLDPAATAEILEVIAHIRAKADITVIVIEHKLDYLMPYASRFIKLEDGCINYDGPLQDGAAFTPDPYNYTLADINPNRATSQDTNPVVHVEGLCVGYNGETVLHDVSLEIQPGEFVAVMGDNGSGKTTLLQSLMGFLKPQAGHVAVFGMDTRQTSISQLARQVGFVFQNPDHQLFAESVWKEATFAPQNFDVLHAACKKHTHDLLNRAGLGTRHDVHPYRLSYGEKRRLNLISVLSYGPRLIMLDEPLIGQDRLNVVFMMNLLCEHAAKGGTVIMVNHNPEVTQHFTSRLIFFKHGRMIVDAPTQTAFSRLAELGHRVYLPSALKKRNDQITIPTQVAIA